MAAPVAVGRVGGATRGAPPPVVPQAAASTGQRAVVKAESMRRAREVSNAADMAALESVVAEEDAVSGRRSVAGRTFDLRNNMWTDVNLKSKTEVVNIEPFSTAYFAVLRALPELKPVWSALPASVTAGKRVGIGLKSGGRKDLNQVEINNLVSKFRG